MTEEDRQRKLVREALAGFVEEEIDAAYFAMRFQGWEDSWKKGPRWIKRHFFASDHPADNTGTYNVLAVTPTRIMVFNAKPKPPLLKIRRQIAEWPRGGVRVTSKGTAAVAHYNQGASMSRHRIVRATLAWEGEERPLILDFPKGPLTHEVLEAAKRAPSAAPAG